MQYDGYNVKHAEALLCSLFDKFSLKSPAYGCFSLCYTTKPKFVGGIASICSIYKLVNKVYLSSPRSVLGYVVFRVQPETSSTSKQLPLSSIEIYTGNSDLCLSYWCVIPSTYSSSEGLVFEAFWVLASLFESTEAPSIDRLCLLKDLLSFIPKKYFDILHVKLPIFSSRSLELGLQPDRGIQLFFDRD